MEPTTKKIARIDMKDSTVFVSGAIDFDNVVTLWQQGTTFFDTLKNIKEIRIDLKGLDQSDSSGLALFTGWVRVAQEKNKAIKFMNMPTFMKDILHVCGLEGVLPVLWEN